MKTLEHRSTETIEVTTLEMEGSEKITFHIKDDYNHYTDGTKELFKRHYVKNDSRPYVNISESYRTYGSEKGYRGAIKRWSKKAIETNTTFEW